MPGSFGASLWVAKIHSAGERSAEVSQDQGGIATMSGDIMGTPAYMAPEQVQDSADVDTRADIYALGIMLYEALTGRRPFEGPTMDLLLAHMFTAPKLPSLLAAELGIVRPSLDWPRLDAIVLKMLAKERDERYQDCQLLMEELAMVWPMGSSSSVSLGPLSAVTPAQAPAPAPPTRRVFLGGALGLALGAGVAAGLGALLQRRRRPMHPRTLAEGRNLATEMIAAAQQGTPAERSELLGAIAGARSRALTSVVVRALGDEHSGVAQAALAAALAVGQLGDPLLAEALRLKSMTAIGPAAVEIAVARAQLGDEAARPLLRAAAAGSLAVDATTRLRAAMALVEAKQEPVALLRAALFAANKSEALRPALRRAALTALVRLQDAQTVLQLTAARSAPSPAERLEAAAVLTAAGSPEAADDVLRAAQAAEGSERVELCMSLADAGDPRGLPLLPALLRGPQPELRQRATMALALIGRAPAAQAEVTELVLPLLDDPDPRVATTAAVVVLSLFPAAALVRPGNARGPLAPGRERA